MGMWSSSDKLRFCNQTHRHEVASACHMVMLSSVEELQDACRALGFESWGGKATLMHRTHDEEVRQLRRRRVRPPKNRERGRSPTAWPNILERENNTSSFSFRGQGGVKCVCPGLGTDVRRPSQNSTGNPMVEMNLGIPKTHVLELGSSSRKHRLQSFFSSCLATDSVSVTAWIFTHCSGGAHGASVSSESPTSSPLCAPKRKQMAKRRRLRH